MLKKTVLIIAILTAGLFLGHFELRRVTATPVPAMTGNPTPFSLIAFFNGWNSSATGLICSPGGTANCNPLITEFRGVFFTATARWAGPTDPGPHTFAIYTSDTTPDQVFPTDLCSLTSQHGCLKATKQISSTSQTVLLSFNATIPKDGPPFTGPGLYNYYCQIHPGSMNGQIQVYKDPDVNRDHAVNIVDLATIAVYFGQNTTSVNQVADLNNDGKVNILDLAFDAFYFGATI